MTVAFSFNHVVFNAQNVNQASRGVGRETSGVTARQIQDSQKKFS